MLLSSRWRVLVQVALGMLIVGIAFGAFALFIKIEFLPYITQYYSTNSNKISYMYDLAISSLCFVSIALAVGFSASVIACVSLCCSLEWDPLVEAGGVDGFAPVMNGMVGGDVEMNPQSAHQV